MCSNRKGPQTHRYKEPANPHSENKIFFHFSGVLQRGPTAPMILLKHSQSRQSIPNIFCHFIKVSNLP